MHAVAFEVARMLRRRMTARRRVLTPRSTAHQKCASKSTHLKIVALAINLCFLARKLRFRMKMQNFHLKNHRASKNMLEILAPNAHRRFSLKGIVPVPWQERTRLQNSHSRRGGVAKRTSTFSRGSKTRPDQVRSRIGCVDNSKIRIPTTGGKQTFLATAQLPECMF